MIDALWFCPKCQKTTHHEVGNGELKCQVCGANYSKYRDLAHSGQGRKKRRGTNKQKAKFVLFVCSQHPHSNSVFNH